MLPSLHNITEENARYCLILTTPTILGDPFEFIGVALVSENNFDVILHDFPFWICFTWRKTRDLICENKNKKNLRPKPNV